MSKFDGNQGIEEYDCTEQKPHSWNVILAILCVGCIVALFWLLMHV